MAETFSLAFTVLIWLGTPEELGFDRDALAHLTRAYEPESPISALSPLHPEPDGPLEAMRLKNAALEFLFYYIRLLKTRWFQRVWVVQEYALSQRPPFALLGHVAFSMEALFASKQIAHRFFESATQMEVPLWIKQNMEQKSYQSKDFVVLSVTAEAHEVAFSSRYLPKYLQTPEFREKPPAHQLLDLLTNVTGKSVRFHMITYMAPSD